MCHAGPLLRLSKPHLVLLWSVGFAGLLSFGAAHLGNLPPTMGTRAAVPLYVLTLPRLVAPAPPAPDEPRAPVPTAPTPPAAAEPIPGPPVLDEQFTNNALGWPDNQRATGWFVDDGYQLEPREQGRFVAVTPFESPVLDDVSVSAVFHKLDGRPPGGGYGIIVRDQSDLQLDGVRTTGRYYVLEVTDRGEVGVFRRESDHWDTLIAWTPCPAARPGTADNQLTVNALGGQLSLLVNGSEAVQVADTALRQGRVGVFVGGDGNAVVLSRLVVRHLT